MIGLKNLEKKIKPKASAPVSLLSKVKTTHAIYCYIRVSTEEQNTARQEAALAAYAVQHNIVYQAIFIEKCSGKAKFKPEFEALKKQLRPLDVLVVDSFDRISRSMTELSAFVTQMREQSVRLISLHESVDVETPQGYALFHFIAIFADFEARVNKERQFEGIAQARLIPGKYKGRKPIKKPAVFDACFEKYMHATKGSPYSLKQFMRESKLKQSTLLKFIKNQMVETSCKKLIKNERAS
jgi:DNA invertase Pin-like site-specific DNA recombinase